MPNALTIAVVGKRDLARADATLRDRIAEALAAVAARSAAGPATRGILLTSLAEGADQLAAEVALAMGWELRCVFPFRDYWRDFAHDAGALARFQTLSASASAVEVLDGNGCRRAEGYAAAARRLVERADWLVAVIDDDDGEERTGGTRETVGHALRRRLPVVTIGASSPHPVRFRLETAKRAPAPPAP